MARDTYINRDLQPAKPVPVLPSRDDKIRQLALAVLRDVAQRIADRPAPRRRF